MATPSRQDDGQSFVPFTKAERIQQLNDIDKSITALLQSAGLALKTLTASQLPSEVPDKRQAFQDMSNNYLKTLQSVDVRLRRQIYGLEEAKIVPVTLTKIQKKATHGFIKNMDDGLSEQEKKKKREEEEAEEEARAQLHLHEGGMGKLDVGWLNSRSGKVASDMEAELWAKSRAFLEGLEGTAGGLQNGRGNVKDHEMSG